MVLAFADIALALSAGASAEASCALALATDGGIVVERPVSSSAISVAFLPVEDFSAALPDFRCAYFFQWREPCLVYFFVAAGAPAAVSDFALAAAPGAACDGTRETHEQSCR